MWGSPPPSPVWAACGAAALAFLATSVDELLVLVSYFARARVPGATISTCDVLTGSVIGFSCVLAISAVGVAGAAVPAQYVKLLGLVPLFLGLRQLVRRALKARRRARAHKTAQTGGDNEASDSGASDAEVSLLPAPARDAYAALPNGATVPPDDSAVTRPSPASAPRPPCCSACAAFAGKCLRPGMAEMVAVMLAGGVEEVSVFLPLLASEASAPWNAFAVVATLCGCIAAWLALAAALVRCPPVARAVEWGGEAAEPWLVIAIGVYCLVGSIIVPVSLWE